MNIMGVDLSTKAVTAVMLDHEENLIDWWHIVLPGETSLERARNASEPLRAIPWGDPSIIAFERPAGRGTAAVMDMWRVMGVILGAHWDVLSVRGWEYDELGPIQIWEMTPPEWKKLVGLPGNASKERVADHAWANMKTRELGSLDTMRTPQDFYDAYCIALAAVRLNARGET